MTTPASLAPAAPVRETFHHGDLRHALLVAAEAQLREVGPENFSLREAARAAELDPVEHAAWTTLGLLVLNLDETLSKE